MIMLWLSVWSWLPAYVIVAAVVPYWLPSGERPTGVFRPLMYVGSAAAVARARDAGLGVGPSGGR